MKACRSFTAFGRLCLLKIGVFNVSAPKVPKWFEACFEAYWKTCWKKMPVGITDESITSRDVGFYMGYIPWYKKWMQAWEADLEKLNFPEPKLSKLGEKRVYEAWEKALIPDEIKADFERFESGEADKDLELVDQCVADLPLHEASMFHEGKSKGLLGPSGLADGSLEDTTATAIYIWLMLCWPWVIEYRGDVHAGLNTGRGEEMPKIVMRKSGIA